MYIIEKLNLQISSLLTEIDVLKNEKNGIITRSKDLK